MKIKELFVWIDEAATDDEVRAIAAQILVMSPLMVGVYRPAQGDRPQDRITHETPEMTQ